MDTAVPVGRARESPIPQPLTFKTRRRDTAAVSSRTPTKIGASTRGKQWRMTFT